MFPLLVIAATVSVSISFVCSVMEAALLCVPVAHAKYYADRGNRSGRILLKFKEQLAHPVSAILILNTLAHTIGASVSGALVAKIYGEDVVVAFSLLYTAVVLFLSEILPKQIGTLYSRPVSLFIAFPLKVMIWVLYPLIKIGDWASMMLKGKEIDLGLTDHEFVSMAQLGTEEGVIDHLQGSVIKNIIGLDRLLVKDVLTPRVVVFRQSETTKLCEIKDAIIEWNYSRVPIFSEDDPEQVTGYVTQRDLYRAFLSGDGEKSLVDFKRKLNVVPEQMRADKLLLSMFENREAICAVVDEHAGFAGIVTLEDVIEEVVGREILDEYDLVSDLRTYAQMLYKNKIRKKS